MKPYLGVFGHTALDIIIRVSELPEVDSSIAIEKRLIRFGGTGANIARASAELGVGTSLCSFVGEDFPDDYLEALKNAGVDTEGLKKKEGYNTPRCWIVTDGKGKEFTLIDQGAMKDMESFKIPKKIIKKCEVLHIGTGRPGHYKKVIDDVDTEDKTIAFDPAQELEYVYEPKTFISFLKKSDLFFCNQKEKEVALRYADLRSVEDLLNSFDLDTIVVTEGSKGCTLFLPEKKVKIAPYEPDEVVEATGAGDAFRAGFYAALSRDHSIEDCCKFGAARASFNLEHAGSQEKLVGWDDVLSRVERNS